MLSDIRIGFFSHQFSVKRGSSKKYIYILLCIDTFTVCFKTLTKQTELDDICVLEDGTVAYQFHSFLFSYIQPLLSELMLNM